MRSVSECPTSLSARPSLSVRRIQNIHGFQGTGGIALAKEKTLGKSEDQLRRREAPRNKEIKNFVAVVGNKEIANITRDDMLDQALMCLPRSLPLARAMAMPSRVRIRISAASAGKHRPDRPQAHDALTFKLDQSMGARHWQSCSS